MALFSKLKSAAKKVSNAYQSATKGLQQVGKNIRTTIASATSKTKKQTGAASMAFPVPAGTDIFAGRKARIAKDEATYRASQAKNIGFNPAAPEGGGNIEKAIRTGQLPRDIGTRTGPSAATPLGRDLNPTAPILPTSITASSLMGSSRTSAGASISLPSYSAPTGGAGALASATSGLAVPSYGTVNPDGSTTQIDPKTGKPKVTPKEDQTATFFQDYLDKLEAPPDTAAMYEEAQREAGLQQKQQEVANYSAQLNAIQAQAQADQLSLTGQGRGIPEVIIGGQQAQIAKEAAIKALPVAAQLAAAQNNLELAQQHVDTMFRLMSQDAQNQYEFRTKTRESVFNFLTAQEKNRLAEIQKQDTRAYEQTQNFLDMKNKLLQSAYAQGAPSSIKTAIQLATNPQEAIAAAGRYNGTIPKASTSNSRIGSLEARRLNEDYLGAGVLPSDTEAQADAKVAALTSPAAVADELRQYITSLRETDLSYDDVVASIKSDPDIKDKQTALNVAGEVYGDTFVSRDTGPSVIDRIGDFFRAISD